MPANEIRFIRKSKVTTKRYNVFRLY